MAFSYLCLLIIISSFLTSPSSSTPFTLNLSPTPKPNFSSDKDIISNLIKSSIQRAHHLKNPNKKRESEALLYPHSFGDYSVPLSFGTPPQTLPFIFDTGSSVAWAPCTRNYKCINCSASGIDIAKIPTFKPKRSSSTKHINCRNPKCRLLTWPNLTYPFSCSTTEAKHQPCFYGLSYGDGSVTAGKAITENVRLPHKIYNEITIGCSLLSVSQQEGIVGFGRSPVSFPNQLNLDKFAYCLVAHKFDDTPKNSKLILGDNTSELTLRLRYTPFLKSPPMPPFADYYYVELIKITVGRVIINVPRVVSIPDAQGNGGTVVDSGSTLTSLPSAVFYAVVERFLAQTSSALRRVASIEDGILCFNISSERKQSFPEVVFHFNGGVKIELPVSNYVRQSNIVCLPFMNETFQVGQSGSGPGIVLGNYQQQNLYIEFDLKNQRLGLKKQLCG